MDGDTAVRHVDALVPFDEIGGVPEVHDLANQAAEMRVSGHDVAGGWLNHEPLAGALDVDLAGAPELHRFFFHPGVANLLRQLHRAEFGTAHRTEVRHL